MTRLSLSIQLVLESSSDEKDDDYFLAVTHVATNVNESDGEKKYRGSIQGHRVLRRDRIAGHHMLYQDYFSENPTYGHCYLRRRYAYITYIYFAFFKKLVYACVLLIFKCRFRMRRTFFERLWKRVEQHDAYFVQKRNVAGILGLSSLQKVTAAFRMLTYGVAADATDDYIRIGESTPIESLGRFISGVVGIFGGEYLRSPNEDDTSRLLAIGESRGFPGILGSIDCMHGRSKNYPSTWQGMYTGHVHEPTIILEAVVDKDLWIWHPLFGMSGSHNDINILHRSSLFARLAEGQAPRVNYTLNNNEYTMGYYLADDIYPSWAIFMKTIPEPQGNKKKYFATAQEACRKDVEKYFGIL
jgi:hypothetical protein